MFIFDCTDCQQFKTCMKPQKEKDACPSIDPPMCCGDTMRMRSSVASDKTDEPNVGPTMTFHCIKCKKEGRVFTSREPEPPRKSLADPVMPRVNDGKIPQDIVPTP